MIFVPGSTVVDCPELSDLEQCWELGEKSRHVGATKMNAGSSRSHLIVSMLLETTNKQTGKSAVGKLSLIDLAGSERAGKTVRADTDSDFPCRSYTSSLTQTDPLPQSWVVQTALAVSTSAEHTSVDCLLLLLSVCLSHQPVRAQRQNGCARRSRSISHCLHLAM